MHAAVLWNKCDEFKACGVFDTQSAAAIDGDAFSTERIASVLTFGLSTKHWLIQAEQMM